MFRRWLKPLLLATAILVLAGVLGAAWVRSRLTPQFLETVLNDALIPATRGLYRVDVDDMDLDVLGGTLRLLGVQLSIRPEGRDSLAEAEGLPAVRFEGNVAEVALEEVQLLRLVRNRELEAGRFLVRRPAVWLTLTARADLGEEEDSIGPPAGPADTVKQRWKPPVLPPGTPVIRLGHVAIEEVALHMDIEGDPSRGTTGASSEAEGLAIELENLVIDPAIGVSRERPLLSDDVTITFRKVVVGLEEGGTVTVGPFRGSASEQSLRIEGVTLDPGRSEADYLADPRAPGDHIVLRTGTFRLEGIDFAALLFDAHPRATSALLDSIDITITSDKTKTGAAPVPGFMPHTVFRQLPVLVTVDTFRLQHGVLTYRERGTRTSRMGSISFEDMNATVTNITNDRTRMSQRTPALVQARARLFGVAPLWATIVLPLLSPGPTMDVTARIGRFDATVVNRMVRPLEGVQVTSGEVDSAWVRIAYRPGQATGEVVAIYRNLGVRMEDARTRRQNLGQRLMSMAANTMLRSGNDPKPGGRPRSGRVNHTVRSGAPIFETLWYAVRAGMLDLIRH